MAQIEVEQLSKTYRVPERQSGLRAALRALLRRRHTTVEAVRAISFEVREGEIVGFLGPNGAGKTTTLKMLTGLLHPSAGTARVLGHTPWRREREYLRQISLLMGQRSQLMWDLPVMDSFQVQLAVYDVPRTEGKRTLDELVELLDIRDVLGKPTRTLSLGQRMKCEIALHAAYWKYVTRRRLRGDKRGSFPLKGSNWFAVDSLDEAGWAGVLKLLQEQHRLLRETVAGFAPGRWSSAPPGSKLRYADQVIGVAFHDIYHAGQIQTLKALQRS